MLTVDALLKEMIPVSTIGPGLSENHYNCSYEREIISWEKVKRSAYFLPDLSSNPLKEQTENKPTSRTLHLLHKVV